MVRLDWTNSFVAPLPAELHDIIQRFRPRALHDLGLEGDEFRAVPAQIQRVHNRIVEAFHIDHDIVRAAAREGI